MEAILPKVQGWRRTF